MFSPLSPKPDKKETGTMASKILGFCFAVFAGVLLLHLALELLARFWVWLVVIAVIVAAVWIGVSWYRRRRDGW